MQLDWIHEKHNRKQPGYDDGTRNLIRRRAIQAAVKTKEKEKGKNLDRNPRSRRQGQKLEPWVVSLSPTGQKSRTVEVLAHEASGLETWLTSARPPRMPKSCTSVQSAYAVPERLIGSLQSPDLPQHVFHTLKRQSAVPDGRGHQYVVLALADATYLQAISACYGNSACLDAALDCLAVRVWDFIAGPVSPARALQLYSRAIRLLQESVANNSAAERFEIYYAVPLLVLFELLNLSDERAHLIHARGAVHVLQAIGPAGMRTELNQMLLVMQSDLMVAENLRDGYGHCCAGPEWAAALLLSVRHDRPPGSLQSEANVTLNVIATALPDALTDVEKFGKRSSSSKGETINNKLLTIRGQLKSWQSHWEPVMAADPYACYNHPGAKVLLATLFMYTALVNRLTAAMPGEPWERIEAEKQALEAGEHAFQITAYAESYGVIAQTRLASVERFVHSVTDTSQEWLQELGRISVDQPVSTTIFATWCMRMGRECTAKA